MITGNDSGAIADIAAVTRGRDDSGFGGSWLGLIVLLAILGWGGGGFGMGGGAMWPMMMNGGMGGYGGFPWLMNGQQGITQSMQNGFDNAALMNSVGALSAALNSGFGDTQLAIAGLSQQVCNSTGNLTNAMNNGFNAAEIAANNRQMANMQRSFDAQTAIDGRLDAIAANQAQCCCENRAAIQDVKYAIATEGAQTRQAMGQYTQEIKDKLCQLELDNYKRENASLQNKLNIAEFNASQSQQNNYLQNALTAQTQYFLSLYPPTAGAARTATAGS